MTCIQKSSLLARMCRDSCKLSLARFSIHTPLASNVSVITDDKGIATLSMDKGPVNSLNMEFIQARSCLIFKNSSIGLIEILTGVEFGNIGNF